MTILYLEDKDQQFEKRQLDNLNFDAITGLVGKEAEAVYLPQNIVLWKNPRAAVLHESKTIVVQQEGELNEVIHGKVIITGTDGNKTVELKEDQIQWVYDRLIHVEEEGEKLPALPY
ncbi:DUF3846 domain-containing protein [Alkalicoccus chagannorensis]|uniref:DUF3846 domain-containing protein n=1 Tax=Alkalicoccus chagannorensis TaxID=427072 RepID=UPI0003FEA619|nr:hypothetical protein [Alkalicoccus chagannorensis]